MDRDSTTDGLDAELFAALPVIVERPSAQAGDDPDNGDDRDDDLDVDSTNRGRVPASVIKVQFPMDAALESQKKAAL